MALPASANPLALGQTRPALPDEWNRQWGSPAPSFRRLLREIKIRYEELGAGLPLIDAEREFRELVAPHDNAQARIHRWFVYKEAFSYRLPQKVLGRFGAGRTKVVMDVFGGVATTPLALQDHDCLDAVVSIEYSPLAQFVGKTKLEWWTLDAARLRHVVSELRSFQVARDAEVPQLSAFHNDQIFDPDVRVSLVSAAQHIRSAALPQAERDFFLVGLAAIVEDVSGVMKDGRALRILRGRERRPKSLQPRHNFSWTGDIVRDALANQWQAMIEDIEELDDRRGRRRVRTDHHRGDARDLATMPVAAGQHFARESVGLTVYSPPYPNCIDYSEVYKLELWLLGFVANQQQFRELRLGTLRSHPSIEFPFRDYFHGARGLPVVQIIEMIADFLQRFSPRDDIGPMVRNYFEDMLQVFREQRRLLEPGGWSVCVIGNSTFSRRERTALGAEEIWRLPVLTDVLLARLAEAAGLDAYCIWKARDLRPRNVNDATARESLLILRKPLN